MIRSAAPSLKLDLLLPIMKDFIIGQLSESHMSDSSPIKSTIGYLELNDNYLVDLPWFKAGFPEQVLMENILAVFQELEAVR